MAARQGLQAQSFDLAAAAYADAVGGPISADSLRRISEGWGRQIAAHRQVEAEQASAPAERGDDGHTCRVVLQEPIQTQANLSTDGARVLIRGEGWKEVKLVAVSAVTVKEAEPSSQDLAAASRRGQEPRVRLSQHSYQAGLWEADSMALYQYAEGLRRGLDKGVRLSSVNDGADWIERITQTNFPQAVQIIDWSHASQRLWLVGQLLYGEGNPIAQQWVEQRLGELWAGQAQAVAGCLDEMAAERSADEVRQAAGYFRKNLWRMRYPEYRAAGYPIGSGTVESAANTVVHHRLRRPGRGWQRDNGQALLAALSELHSDRFEQAWQLTLPAAA